MTDTLAGAAPAATPALLRPANLDDVMAVLVEMVGELAALRAEVRTPRAGVDGTPPGDPDRELDALVQRVFAAVGQVPVIPEAVPA